jgi:uncharacterized OB-fold protein
MIRSAPRPGREAMPHWLGAKAGRLVMPFCTGCGHLVWPPGSACARCGNPLEWRDCSGRGRIVTFSVVHRAVQPEWKGQEPYVVAFVALAEGGRLLTNIIDCDPAQLGYGQDVIVDFVATSDPELGLPVFRVVPAMPQGKMDD